MVSANACWYFKSIAEEAEQASLQVLARHTVASALEEVKKADTSGWDPVPELIAQYKKTLLIIYLLRKKTAFTMKAVFLYLQLFTQAKRHLPVYRASQIYAA